MTGTSIEQSLREARRAILTESGELPEPEKGLFRYEITPYHGEPGFGDYLKDLAVLMGYTQLEKKGPELPVYEVPSTGEYIIGSERQEPPKLYNSLRDIKILSKSGSFSSIPGQVTKWYGFTSLAESSGGVDGADLRRALMDEPIDPKRVARAARSGPYPIEVVFEFIQERACDMSQRELERAFGPLDLNKRDGRSDMTALQFLAANEVLADSPCRLKIATALVRAGADPFVRNAAGERPDEIAYNRGDHELASAIKRAEFSSGFENEPELSESVTRS